MAMQHKLALRFFLRLAFFAAFSFGFGGGFFLTERTGRPTSGFPTIRFPAFFHRWLACSSPEFPINRYSASESLSTIDSPRLVELAEIAVFLTLSTQHDSNLLSWRRYRV